MMTYCLVSCKFYETFWLHIDDVVSKSHRLSFVILLNKQVPSTYWIFLPRDAAMLARYVLGVVILSVRLFVCLSVTRGYFDTTQKGSHSSFLTPTVVGGQRPLPSDICAESDPPPSKNADWQSSAYNVSTVRDSEKVQLWRLGSHHGLSNEP